MAYKFLLISWGTSGNLNPLLTVGRQLRQYGHGVRIMADPAMKVEVAAAGFDFVTWRHAPIGAEADPADFSDMADWVRRVVVGPAAAYAADVQAEIARTRTDAVLCIDILFGAVLGAEAAGVPVAMLSPHTSIRPLPGVPHGTSTFLPPQTPEQLAAVTAANDEIEDLLDDFLPELNEVCERLGLRRLSHGFDIFDRPARVLMGVSEAFEFDANWLPSNMRYLGPLLDEPSWTKPWCAPWVSDRTRALIACSTGAQGQGALVQRILDAVGTLDIEAVATTGPNLPMDAVIAPTNVHLLPSAPHDVVMSEVSLVITQGGHGTVNRALVNGLPLLVLPAGRDQGGNAARVEAKGAGLRLASDASEAEIAAAVRRLIDEPHFRAAAAKLGASIKADIDGDSSVREMTAIIGIRSADDAKRGKAASLSHAAIGPF
jgi:UDP:flavonoid glycosyltransferase YjiC (YdhE family)